MLNAPASSSPFKAVGHNGVGLLLDASAAPIVSNESHLGSILNFGVNLLANSSGTIASNSLTVDHLHTNAFNSTCGVLGPGFTRNWVRFGELSVDQGASGVVGVLIDGRILLCQRYNVL
jgi:hypothetical protein